jgi:hypothetical protein
MSLLSFLASRTFTYITFSPHLFLNPTYDLSGLTIASDELKPFAIENKSTDEQQKRLR